MGRVRLGCVVNSGVTGGDWEGGPGSTLTLTLTLTITLP